MHKKCFFNYIFLFITLCLSTIVSDNAYSAAAAAASSGEDTETFLSPGKKVQASVGEQLLGLKPSLVEIFGAKETEEEYGVLFEGVARIEEPDFRSALFCLERNLKRCLGKGGDKSDKIDQSFLTISRIRFETGNVTEKNLKFYATEYFKKMDGFEGIEFRDKTDGDQFGAKATVQLSGIPSVFYIKTHSLGHKSMSRSSGSHPLDPIELMVYAVLEQLGDSPKSHFFGRDNKTAFIATEEAGKGGDKFNTYDYYLKEGTRKEALWGSEVYRYIEDIPPTEKDTETLMGIMDASSHSRDLADKFTRLDIISRIFRLSDLIGNKGNFGFCLDSDKTIKASIIDFRIIPDERGLYSINEGNLNGFYNGNGIFTPLSVDPFVRHVLRELPAEIRAERARPHAVGIQKRLPEAVNIAIERVMGFIKSISGKIKDGEDFVTQSHKNLMSYRGALLHNVNMYLDYLSRGAPKIS